jgi:hypothetical protein
MAFMARGGASEVRGAGIVPLVRRARQALPVALVLVIFLVVVAALASTYVGHSRSPYDTCYGTNGRAISCAVLEALR